MSILCSLQSVSADVSDKAGKTGKHNSQHQPIYNIPMLPVSVKSPDVTILFSRRHQHTVTRYRKQTYEYVYDLKQYARDLTVGTHCLPSTNCTLLHFQPLRSFTSFETNTTQRLLPRLSPSPFEIRSVSIQLSKSAIT